MQVIDKEIFKYIYNSLETSHKASFLLWEQGVEGSNPFAPTNKKKRVLRLSFFVILVSSQVWRHPLARLSRAQRTCLSLEASRT